MTGDGDTGVLEETSQRYEPPCCTQYSCFLSNRVGRLLELVEVFDGHALQMVALSIIDSADHAVVRLVTSNGDLASRLLTRNHIPYSAAEILVCELQPDQGLTLIYLCKSLLCAEINIHYAYPLMVRPHGAPTIAIHTDNQILAGQILRRKLFTLLGENDLGDNLNPGDLTGGQFG